MYESITAEHVWMYPTPVLHRGGGQGNSASGSTESVALSKKKPFIGLYVKSIGTEL